VDVIRCGRCRKQDADPGYKRCGGCRGYQKQLLDSLTARGLCQKCCKRKPVTGKKYCRTCLTKIDKTNKARVDSGRCVRCKNIPQPGYKHCVPCLAKSQKRWQSLRDEVFVAYGGYRCKCCGETEPRFLQIDHVNNDGAKHRRQMGGGGNHLYLWLKRNKYPEGFQVLCANCNYAKRFGPCPHQVAKEGCCADPTRQEGCSS